MVRNLTQEEMIDMPTSAAGLSALLDTENRHARPGDTIRWAQTTSSRPCDECVALQHETHGRHQRMRPRHRRSIVGAGGTEMTLCAQHAQAWHDRDDYDLDRRR